MTTSTSKDIIPTEPVADKRQTEYIYKNVLGEVEGRVLRTDYNGEKNFLPQRLYEGSFVTGLGGKKLPLYGIEDLPADPKRFIFWVEGEKCVNFIRGHKGCAITPECDVAWLICADSIETCFFI